MALCFICPGIVPEQAWGMRMDVSLMLLAARIRMNDKANRQVAKVETGPAITTRGNRQEVRITSYKDLVGAFKTLSKKGL